MCARQRRTPKKSGQTSSFVFFSPFSASGKWCENRRSMSLLDARVCRQEKCKHSKSLVGVIKSRRVTFLGLSVFWCRQRRELLQKSSQIRPLVEAFVVWLSRLEIDPKLIENWVRRVWKV